MMVAPFGGVVGLSVFASLVIASCGSTVPATVVATTLGTSDIPLRTVPPIELPAGAGEACAGIGIDAVIHGDTHDPHVAWLINKPAMRIDVLWPAGYRARLPRRSSRSSMPAAQSCCARAIR